MFRGGATQGLKALKGATWGAVRVVRLLSGARVALDVCPVATRLLFEGYLIWVETGRAAYKVIFHAAASVRCVVFRQYLNVVTGLSGESVRRAGHFKNEFRNTSSI
jgi:hypothetical protein